MKHLLIALFALALPLCAADVTVTFDYDFTGGQACSATVTTNCFDRFEAGLLVGSALNTLVSVPVPAATGKVLGISGNFSVQGAFGQQQVSVVMVAKDGSGGRITSEPLKCVAVIVIIPSAPSGMRLTLALAIGPTFPPNPWEG